VPLLVDRQKYLAMNPLAAAKMFQTIVEHVFSKLFGMNLAHKTKSSGLPPGKRPQGALGHAWDGFVIFETQDMLFIMQPIPDTVLLSRSIFHIINFFFNSLEN
jgi:hypothetical protein